MMGALPLPRTVPYEEAPVADSPAPAPMVRTRMQGCGLSYLGPCECRPIFMRLLVWALRRSRR